MNTVIVITISIIGMTVSLIRWTLLMINRLSVIMHLSHVAAKPDSPTLSELPFFILPNEGYSNKI